MTTRCAKFLFVLSILVTTGQGIFGLLVKNAQAYITLTDVPFSNTNVGTSLYWFSTGERADVAFQYTTTTDLTICGVQLNLAQANSAVSSTEWVNVYISASQNTTIAPHTTPYIFLGSFNGTDVPSAWPNWTTITVTSTTCIPILPKTYPNINYYLYLKIDQSATTNTGIFIYKSENYTNESTTSTWWNRGIHTYHRTSPPGTTWTAETQPLWGKIYGETTTTGYILANLPWLTISNTSTNASFWQFCDAGQDFGWWQPLISGLVYLVCPDPSFLQQFTIKKDILLTKMPFGYFTYTKNLIDSQTSASTVHFSLSFAAPSGTTGTATIDLTQAYLDVPIDIRNFTNTWISRIAWLALLIYLVLRVIYFFK